MTPKSTLYGPPKVGGDILSYCTRCKMDLAHVVVSMVDARPAKVQCKTCHSVHKHRLPGGERAPVRRSPGDRRKTPLKSSVRVSELWEQKVSGSRGETVPYQVTRQFTQGDIINHVQFGVGVVEEVRDSGKILVLFRQGEKVLIHGRTA